MRDRGEWYRSSSIVCGHVGGTRHFSSLRIRLRPSERFWYSLFRAFRPDRNSNSSASEMVDVGRERE